MQYQTMQYSVFEIHFVEIVLHEILQGSIES